MGESGSHYVLSFELRTGRTDTPRRQWGQQDSTDVSRVRHGWESGVDQRVKRFSSARQRPTTQAAAREVNGMSGTIIHGCRITSSPVRNENGESDARACFPEASRS